jgi:acyl-CoA thioesterase-1
MARTGKGKTAGGIAGGVLTFLVLCSFASAQDSATSLTPYSRECQIGGQVIAASPLPNVATALENRKVVKILTIGASASSGRRFSKGGYTAQIEQILEHALKGLDVVMINRGISGELAANAATRIKTEVALTNPDLVLWQVGTNDALAYVPLPYLKAAVIDTIHWLRAHNVDLILVGLQHVDAMAQNPNYIAVREVLRQIAAKENVLIVRRGDAMQLIEKANAGGGAFRPDEFERTEAGYNCLAEYVARAIALGAFGKALRPASQAPAPAPIAPPASQ